MGNYEIIKSSPKRDKKGVNKMKPWIYRQKPGLNTYEKHKFDELFSMHPDRSNFGRPVKKKSRVGLKYLNKTGHRRNLCKSAKKQRRKSNR